MDPATQEAIRRAVEEAVARATAGYIPFWWASVIIAALAGVIVYDHTVIIPAITRKKDEVQDGYLGFAKTSAPILDRATDLIEECRKGCPGIHKLAEASREDNRG